MAQDRIAMYAEEGGLNLSRSEPDVDGWDFHFSVPRSIPLDGSNFFDTDPARTAAFAQVKATIGSRRRRAVALSHWRHAATMMMPFFFVILEYERPPRPARLFVVHVDEVLVATVAERLRREGAQANQEPPALHRMTMDLVWDPTHQVPCSGDGLRDALVRHAGHDMMAYAAAKQRWWEGAGRSSLKNRIILYVKGPRTESLQRFADWALGMTKTLRVDELYREETRWGISRAFEPSKEVLVSIGSPQLPGRTTVRISDRNAAEHVRLVTMCVHLDGVAITLLGDSGSGYRRQPCEIYGNGRPQRGKRRRDRRRRRPPRRPLGEQAAATNPSNRAAAAKGASTPVGERPEQC